MLNVIVTDPPRADLAEVDKLAGYGVATVHEAIGRRGYLGRPSGRISRAPASRAPRSPCCAGRVTT